MRLIVAVDKNFGIGLNGKLPWYIKEELKLFKELTKGKILIMGKKTVEKLPNLPDRKILCLTSNKDINDLHSQFYFQNDVKCINYLPESNQELFIAGGQSIYKQALEKENYISEIYISILKNSYDCDTFFDRKLLDNFVIKDSKEYEEFTFYYMKRTNDGEIQYLNLLSKIIKEGNDRNTRNGLTKSIFNHQFKFDLRNGFPLLTTKKMFLRGILEEFLFFLRGDTDTTILSDKKVNIWKGNTSKEFIINLNLPYAEGVMGPMYGYQWRFFNAEYKLNEEGRPIKPENGIDQLDNVVKLIKEDPCSRRILMTAYNPSQADEGVLFPCHSVMMQFYVENDYLDMYCYNRSQDSFLGIPFNIASSSLLLMLVAKLTDKKPRFFYMAMGDVHIYESHIQIINKQIDRLPYKFPELSFPDIKQLDDINNLSVKDFTLEYYKSHPTIKAEMIA